VTLQDSGIAELQKGIAGVRKGTASCLSDLTFPPIFPFLQFCNPAIQQLLPW
jgi:hypothetical protein